MGGGAGDVGRSARERAVFVSFLAVKTVVLRVEIVVLGAESAISEGSISMFLLKRMFTLSRQALPVPK